MGNLPLPPSPGAEFSSPGAAPPVSDPRQEKSIASSPNGGLLDVLREAVTSGTLATDSILDALADTARVLSGADGTAVASRKDGVIVCRARSGDLAPGLGAPLNADSGISGECLRTSEVQICGDASTDKRVDAEVCRSLGIQSIAVIPLRGRAGIFGILEAFSPRQDAFDQEHIASLRALAEIAEMAYDTEGSVSGAGVGAATNRPSDQPAPPPARGMENTREFQFTNRYRILAAVAVGLVAIAAVVRMSWRQAGADIAAGASPQPSASASNSASSSHPQAISAPKPDPATLRPGGERPKSKGVVEPAADLSRLDSHPDGNSNEQQRDQIQSTTDSPPLLSSNASSLPGTRSGPTTTEPAGADISTSDPPPVQIAVSDRLDAMPKLAAEVGKVPEFGGSTSGGVLLPTLVHRIDPIYPKEARIHQIGGSVILDAAIGTDGSVLKVTVVSGSPILVEAALGAVRRWRYNPAQLDGKPVEIEERITIVFNP
jgi:TonB family protein